MRKALTAAALSLLVALPAVPDTAAAQVPADLVGGWLVSSWASPDGTVNDNPQRGLFIFASTGQYSIMWVQGTEPRARYEGESMTDAETLAAYRSIVANSGRFTVDGDIITYDAYIAKDPNYMANWNLETRANARRFRYAVKDGILTLKALDDDGTVLQTATLRRPTEAPGAGQR